MDRDLQLLYRVSQALVRHEDVNALLNDVLDVLHEQIGVQRGTLALRQPNSDVLKIEASKGLTDTEKKRGQYRIGEGVTGGVAESRQAAVIPDVSREPAFLDRTGSRRDAAVAFLCVPIVRQDELLGTISIDRPQADKGVLERELVMLETVSNMVAEAVANIQAQVEEREALLAENRQLRLELSDQFRPDNIIGNCRLMKAVYQQIAQVADSPATVLIRGESGTGKELVARALHYSSSRRGGPFVSVNCAALPENLIESELFGHEKGAFTGALQQRKGRFELADGGTLFLDEIGDISLSLQVSLLRVLQERTFERVGGAETVSVNVRVIAATSQNLETSMTDGRFREDLYYRLNVFPIHMPSLRERRSDILLLADHFLGKYAHAYGKSIRRISTTAINMMMAYHWPGNVRELENCVERAVLTATDEVIHGYNLPPSLQTAQETQTELLPSGEGQASLETLVASYERELIVDALKNNRGNRAAAARQLQTTQRILGYRVKKLGIDAGNFR
jgi:Nif-specific regulatory protein